MSGHPNINIGDRIKFRAVTRWSAAAERRVVNGSMSSGSPTVRYGGHPEFIVRLHEIIEVEGGVDDPHDPDAHLLHGGAAA